MFLLKKQKITLDAFTYHSGVHEHFPIVEANKCFPQWWKDLPKVKEVRRTRILPLSIPMGTAKTCAGIIANYTHGFIMPMWSDLIIGTSERGDFTHEYAASQLMPSITKHEDDTINRHGIALKIATPWMFKEKSGVDFYLTSPFYNTLDKVNRVTTTPGVINFRDQNTVNMNIMLPHADSVLRYDAGEPVLHLIPLTDKEVRIVCHKVSKEEYDDIYLSHYRSSFVNTYTKQKKRCPFH